MMDGNSLGSYLKDRRAKVDPATLGLPLARRRTPGLRREEVAQRANVSATWYTWLEQGRGGAPSADALDRIARALLLSEAEREYLYHLALGRAPEVTYHQAETLPPRLQRILDSLETSPAYIKTSTWDILGWNRAATLVLTDYGKIPASERNLVRMLFGRPEARSRQTNWTGVARFVVAAFRADVARAGATEKAGALIDDLRAMSSEFDALWRENDVRSTYGEFPKQITHPVVGAISLEYSAFAVDGRTELDLVVYNPMSADDREKVRRLLGSESLL